MVQTTNQAVELETPSLIKTVKEPQLQFNTQIISSLKETSRWTNFLAFAGFLTILFVAVAAIGMAMLMSTRNTEFGVSSSSPLFISAVYLFVVAIIAFPLNFLHQFSKKLKLALKANDQDALNLAFKKLTACHRFVGIFALLAVIGYALVLGNMYFG